jgi:hypothetical protein
VIVHDLICDSGHFTEDALVDCDALPRCPECGEPVVICWYRGQAPSTDVLGSTQYSSVLGVEYTSTRDRDRQMAARGYEPGSNVRGGPMTQGGRLPKHFTPKGYENAFQWKGEE